ncbi:hypothetical protein NC652_030604 [Populus alba x Populus x berolinensis]|nr:hypothetical protein NC652_030604 [Populus alba x Populus x berolinensis]
MLELTDSMLRTRAEELVCTLRRSQASDIDKRPALQPIPERLKLLILLLNPNLLIIIVARDGVGHTRLQFVMIMSTLFGSILCLVNRSWTNLKSTISTSSIVELKEGSHGNWWTPVGKWRGELGECLVPCST